MAANDERKAFLCYKKYCKEVQKYLESAGSLEHIKIDYEQKPPMNFPEINMDQFDKDYEHTKQLRQVLEAKKKESEAAFKKLLLTLKINENIKDSNVARVFNSF